MDRLTKREKLTIMLAIMASMLFAALNQTSIGTALPRIIASLGGMEYYSWTFTVYILTSAVVMIIVGKLSDIYGRKVFLILGLSVFMIGSLLCGTAQNIVAFIVYRGVQGLGAGMIFANAIAAVGDLFSPKERGRWQGLMASVFGVASLVGPALGGIIVDKWHWPWVFWVNLPIGCLALVLIVKLFPHQPGERTKIDYGGALLLVVCMLATLSAFSLAGVQYSWTSVPILGLFTVSLLFLVLFIWAEKKVESPILPLPLFRNSIYTLSSIIGLISGFMMFGVIMFIPLFVQGAIGLSATVSGMILTPMMLSWVTISAVSGQITSRTGLYKKLIISGVFLAMAGLFMLTQVSADTSPWLLVFCLIVFGAGLGIIMPTFMLIVQNASPHRFLGVISSSTMLYRQLGGTIGVAVMGSWMTTRLSADIVQGVSEREKAVLDQTGLTQLTDPQMLLDPNFITVIRARLSADMVPIFDQLQSHLQSSLGSAIQSALTIAFTLSVIAFVLTLFIREIPLREHVGDPGEPIAEDSDSKSADHDGQTAERHDEQPSESHREKVASTPGN